MAYGIGSSRSNRYEREQYQRYCSWVDRINVAIRQRNDEHPAEQRRLIVARTMGDWLARRYDAALSGLALTLGVSATY